MQLLEWRKAENKTLDEVAPKIGVTASTLSKIERGTIWVAGDTVAAILKVTKGKVTANDLHEGWRNGQAVA